MKIVGLIWLEDIIEKLDWKHRVAPMEKVNSEREPIPEFETLEQIAEFWDTHSLAGYDDLTHEVHFDVRLHSQDKPSTILLLPELGQTLTALASARGVSVETLVNVWLTEKVFEFDH